MVTSRKVAGEQSEITASTRANWNAGFFLILLGAAIAVALPLMLRAPWLYCIPSGTLAAAGGAWMVRSSRKRYTVTRESIVIQDGLFAKPVTFALEGDASLRLREQEEQIAGKSVTVLLVILVVGKAYYVLDHRRGNPLESRSLAEALARAIPCSLLEETDETFTAKDEIALSFRERAQRHRGMAARIELPAECPLTLLEENGTQRYRWKLLTWSLSVGFFWLGLAVAVVAMAPILPGPPEVEHRHSFFDLARHHGEFGYFLVTGAFLAVLGLVPFAGSREVVATSTELTVLKKLFGFPVSRRQILAGRLDEIWVARGPFVYLLSDQLQLACRVPTQVAAAWMASRLRLFYAG